MFMNRYTGQVSVNSRLTAQRGAVGLTLAVIAMLSVSTFVIPMLVRAANANQLQSYGPLKTESGRSAVEHTFWRLREDPTFLSGFTGNPPQNTYQLNAAGLDAQINVTSSDYSTPDHTLDLVVTASPAVIPASTSTEVTFTLTAFNNSETAQEIDWVEIFPQGSVSTSFVTGSSAGFESSDPSVITGGWRWDVWPYVSVNQLGASEKHQWTLDMNGSEGNYWLDIVVHTVAGETFRVPIETAVKATDISGLSIETNISPEVVEADVSNQFDVQIIMLNTGSTEDVTRIRYVMPSDLSYVADSTGGVTSTAPTVTTGYGPAGDRTLLEWVIGVSGFELETNQPQQLTFSVSGALTIGEFSTESTFRIDSDGAAADDFTISTGQAPVISATRKFDVTITQDDLTVDAETWLVSNEPVISWVREK